MRHKELLVLSDTISDYIPQRIMDIVFQERYLQVWVPKKYGGLGYNFCDGLQVLKELATINGSLGWMVTLCAGANYFSRNLKPHIAEQLFTNNYTCFGGSGMIGGTAEKVGDSYLINGQWKYATGAPHLSHFTINATIVENGTPVLNSDGEALVRSFVLKKDDVTILPDWQSMGMKATGTYSFAVEQVSVHEDYSFLYNIFYTNNILDNIPFRIFADLTLLVNYIGMALHFYQEAKKLKPQANFEMCIKKIKALEDRTFELANRVEVLLETKSDMDAIKNTIHNFGTKAVQVLAQDLLQDYMKLGILASQEQQPINTIFKDFFTASQHANFRS